MTMIWVGVGCLVLLDSVLLFALLVVFIIRAIGNLDNRLMWLETEAKISRGERGGNQNTNAG